MDAVINTSMIRIAYPNDRQQPRAFRIQVGRSTGSYFYDIYLSRTINEFENQCVFPVEQFIDGSVTGIYYILVSAIHYDSTHADFPEFTINVVVPTDVVVAPIVSVY